MFSKQTPAIYGTQPRRGPTGSPSVGQVMAVGEDGAFEWSDLPAEPDLSGYAPLAGWTPSRVVVTDGNGDLGISTLAASKLGYLDVVTPGVVEASKAPVVNSTKDLGGIRRLGLGIDAPATNLHIFDGSADANVFVRIQNDAHIWQFGIFGSTSDIFAIRDATNSANPFTIEPGTAANTLWLDSASGGRVGVGNNNPQDKFHASGGVRADYFQVNGDTYLSRLSAGHFRVGTTSSGADGALTLANLSLTGLLNSIAVAKLSYLDVATPGTAQANKALVADANRYLLDLQRLRIGPTTSDRMLSVGGDSYLAGNVLIGSYIRFIPGTNAPTFGNGQGTFDFPNNTTFRVKYQGDDGVVRSASITLA